jgi:hypothetical protein
MEFASEVQWLFPVAFRFGTPQLFNHSIRLRMSSALTALNEPGQSPQSLTYGEFLLREEHDT